MGSMLSSCFWKSPCSILEPLKSDRSKDPTGSNASRSIPYSFARDCRT